MTTDAETIAIYDAKASDYVDAFTDVDKEPGLARFIAHLSEGSRVLDFGCGPGAHAAAMHAQGLDVVAMDASASMVEMARKHKGIEVRQGVYEDLAEIRGFDGIWAHFSLLHAPRDAFPDHLGRIAHALKLNGLFHIALKTGTGERRDKLGRFYTFFTADELRDHLQQAGFAIISEVTGEGAGLSGTVDPWIEVLSRLDG